MARGILVPQPIIEPASPALEAWSLNHWTAREVNKKCAFLTRLLGDVLSLKKE